MKVCDTEKCTGCLSCMNLCAKGAISIGLNEYGVTIPQINEQLCVHCGLCSKKCPVNTPVRRAVADYCIAAWSRNNEDIELSSSGGAAAVFSQKVLGDGGVVFGAASLDGTIKHIGIDSIEKIDLLRGSKYVQSDVGYSYRKIKELLEMHRSVLFFGTPCQVAGLLAFLPQSYDNLITVDLVCHGVPPMKYLEEHIFAKIKGARWEKVSFRGRDNWKLTVRDYDNQIQFQSSAKNDMYYSSFLTGMTYRENCYSCSYANIRRCSDVTIGDFWGLNWDELKEKHPGKVSLILPNTEKGVYFTKTCDDFFVSEILEISAAVNPKQHNLIRPTDAPEDREVFLKKYPKFGFEKAIGNTVLGHSISKELKRQKRQRFINICKYLLTRIMERWCKIWQR